MRPGHAVIKVGGRVHRVVLGPDDGDRLQIALDEETYFARVARLGDVLSVTTPQGRHDLELVKGLVGQHIKRLGMYRCEQCGFRAKQYYWRCPGCGKWETYTPRRTETPDGYV